MTTTPDAVLVSWTPITVARPPALMDVLVTYIDCDGEELVDFAWCAADGVFRRTDESRIPGRVTAWMAPPEPYRGEQR